MATESTGARPTARTGPSLAEVATAAAEQVTALTGRQVEGVIGVEPLEDGWRVQVEVIEVARIPASADILALYEVDLDQAQVRSYRRVRRYSRGSGTE